MGERGAELAEAGVRGHDEVVERAHYLHSGWEEQRLRGGRAVWRGRVGIGRYQETAVLQKRHVYNSVVRKDARVSFLVVHMCARKASD